MDTLTLDPANPEVAEAIAECKVGEEKTLLVTGTVTAMGKEFTMDVTSAAYAEPEEDEEDEEEDEEVEAVPQKKSGKVIGKGGNPGLWILLGKES